LGLVKIDPRFLGMAAGRHAAFRQPAAVVGTRQVFRRVCDRGGPGRSGRGCIGSPSLGERQRPPRSPGSGAAPRTPRCRSDGSARLCRSAAVAGAECIGVGSGGLDPEHEGKRELLAMVALHSLDGERKGPPELSQERETRAVMQTSVQAQHAVARAVVQGGVLKRPAARDPHVLHVDLHRLSWFRLFEQPHLAGFPLAGPAQPRHPNVPKHTLNRAHGEPNPMHALQPEARTSCPVAELLAGVADQLERRGRHLASPMPRIGRHQPLDTTAPPALPPPTNRPSTDSVVPARGCWPVCPCVLQYDQAMPHPRPVLRPNLHIAELDHWPPLIWTARSGHPSKQRRSILSRYFRRDTRP